MNTGISVRGLTKRFGPFLAVDALSFEVARGEVLGFLGPNGSGKSTTMRMVSGFLRPTAGTAVVCGIDVQEEPIAARRCMGYLPEGAPPYAEMTPQSYLRFVGAAHGMSGASLCHRLAKVVESTRIASVLHQPMDTLSKGYRRRVGLAHALIHDPQVLILDEPTDGLDPNQKFEIRSLIEQMAPEKTIVVSTHILEEVDAICTRAIIIAEGRIIADSTPGELEARSRYQNAVSVAVSEANAERVEGVLSALDAVAAVERRAEGSGSGEVSVLALAREGMAIAPDVALALREHSLPQAQMQPVGGQLDDVFRTLTSQSAHMRSRRRRSAPAGAADFAALAGQGKSAAGHDVWTVCRRELLGYFTTPLAYVFIVIFLAAQGALTFFAGAFFEQGQANLQAFFQFHPWLYLFLVPALAMRLWAEERKTGSIELLLTLPITTFGAVAGKFFAAWAVAAVALASTWPMWVTVNYLGEPDNGTIVAGYAGSLLMAGAYLAIGTAASALTKNQVIAFILAAAACFVFTASGFGLVLEFFSGWAPDALLRAVSSFSFLEHFQGFTRGVLDVRDLAFFAGTIAFFLFATTVCVDRNKTA